MSFNETCLPVQLATSLTNCHYIQILRYSSLIIVRHSVSQVIDFEKRLVSKDIVGGAVSYYLPVVKDNDTLTKSFYQLHVVRHDNLCH